MTNNYERYALVKLQIAALEGELEAIKPELISDMKERDVVKDEQSTSLGSFTLQSRKTWKYSKETSDMAEELKVRQIQEQDSDVATATIAESLVFKSIQI